MTELFKGVREEFFEWRKMLKFKLREKGLESVAINVLKRPLDLVATVGSANSLNALEEKQLLNERQKSQIKWDEKNERAHATLISHLFDQAFFRFCPIHLKLANPFEGFLCPAIGF